MQGFNCDNSRPFTHRVNEQIRVPYVRVVLDGGQQLGEMGTILARKKAQEMNLDLVEIVPNARPPVCRIMDYGKWRYEESIKEKNKRKNRGIDEKQINLSPVIDDNDINTKVNQAKKFLSSGKRVIFVLKMKGRMIIHKDRAFNTIKKITDALVDVGTVEAFPRLEGNNIFCRMISKNK